MFTFAYLATASHVLDPASYSRISICWAIMFVILSVIYRPIEQLLSRTIADRRARGLHGHILRTPALIQVGVRDAVPGRRAGAAIGDRARPVRRLDGAVLDPRDRRARLRRELLRARLAGRQQAVRAVRRARVPRVDLAASCSRSRSRSGSPPARRRSGSAWRWRRSSSLCVIPFAFSRRPARRPRRRIEVADAAREGPAHAEIEEAATDLSLQARRRVRGRGRRRSCSPSRR